MVPVEHMAAASSPCSQSTGVAAAQFRALWPAVVFFVGFASYFAVTIGMTEWRRKIRVDMHRRVRCVPVSCCLLASPASCFALSSPALRAGRGGKGQ
jgi:hypothetical protein